jgi:hypothetical protein
LDKNPGLLAGDVAKEEIWNLTGVFIHIVSL